MNLNLEEGDLRNLSGFSAAGFANDDGCGVSLDEVENGGAVLGHRQSLALLLDAGVAMSCGRGMVRTKQEEKTTFFIVDYATLWPLRPGFPELRHVQLFTTPTHGQPPILQSKNLLLDHFTSEGPNTFGPSAARMMIELVKSIHHFSETNV